jgi:penicillin-binding protein 1A
MSRRERQKRRRRTRGHPVTRMLMVGAVLGVCGVVLGVLAGVGWVVAVADSGPNLSELKGRAPHSLTQIFAADGSSLGYVHSDTIYNNVGNRVPRLLKQATVAIEDRRFYQHGALDYQGILRAGVKDLFGGGNSLQGASTLTMQLVDNKYMPAKIAANHNLKYKIIQAKLAEQLENRRSKSWILMSYLRDVPYGTVGGQTAIGVGAASQVFFDKPVWKLDLSQLALLAGLPQAPSQYNPFLHPALARKRRGDVLRAMVASDYITPQQAAVAGRQPLAVHSNTMFSQRRQPYVFDYVVQQLLARFGARTVEDGGLKVYTTIDLKRQQEARDAIVKNEGIPGDPAAAVVTIDPHTGHILAMATSSTYNETTFDYATQSHRQTGSAFKVFVLMTLIHDFQGDPNTTYYNSHELLPGWLPGYPDYHVQTSEHSYLGDVSITKATTLSDNTVFAQLDADVGPDKVRDTAYAMGITSHLDGLPAEGIGGLRIGVSPLEMADAYATLANGGTHIAPTIVTKVVFPDGSTVNLGDPPHKRVFTEGEAYAATQVLKTVITSGTGTAAQYGCPAAGKTGTTSNYTDAWFVGYTPQLSTAVWVGYPNRTTSMTDVNGLGPGFGGTLAAPIWHDYMETADNGYCSDFPTPAEPFHGTPFKGQHATTGKASIPSSRFGPGTGVSTGTGGVAVPPSSGSPQNNPTLFAHPPQPAAGNSGGAGAGGSGAGGSGGSGGNGSGGAGSGGGGGGHGGGGGSGHGGGGGHGGNGGGSNH